MLFSITLSPALAAVNAEFTGRVLHADGSNPREGVVIILVDPESEQEFRSEPTNAEGVFNIASATAGTYTLIAETPEGAFLATDNLVLQEGQNRPLSLTLELSAGNPATEGLASGSLPNWGKWLIVGFIALGAIYVIDQVTKKDSDSDISETNP